LFCTYVTFPFQHLCTCLQASPFFSSLPLPAIPVHCLYHSFPLSATLICLLCNKCIKCM
jgi:hypothetical protein